MGWTIIWGPPLPDLWYSKEALNWEYFLCIESWSLSNIIFSSPVSCLLNQEIIPWDIWQVFKVELSKYFNLLNPICSSGPGKPFSKHCVLSNGNAYFCSFAGKKNLLRFGITPLHKLISIILYFVLNSSSLIVRRTNLR